MKMSSIRISDRDEIFYKISKTEITIDRTCSQIRKITFVQKQLTDPRCHEEGEILDTSNFLV